MPNMSMSCEHRHAQEVRQQVAHTTCLCLQMLQGVPHAASLASQHPSPGRAATRGILQTHLFQLVCAKRATLVLVHELEELSELRYLSFCQVLSHFQLKCAINRLKEALTLGAL